MPALLLTKSVPRASDLFFPHVKYHDHGFPGGTVVKNLPANAGHSGDMDLIPGSGRSPGGGNGNPFQCSRQESSMVREAWQATVHRVIQSQTELSD